MSQDYKIPKKNSCSVEEREKFWRKIISDQEASGLMMADFCTHHKIGFSTFKNWKYRLKAKNKRPFVPITVLNTKEGDPINQQQTVDLRLNFANGNNLQISGGLSRELINHLIAMAAK